MTISANDIQLRYSGGPLNYDPLRSVGGSMSVAAVTSDALGNLFDSDPTLLTGRDYVDCRALYILNTNESSTWYDVSISCIHDPANGTDIQLWVPARNEQQQIVFPNFAQIQGGSFSLKNGTADNAITTSPIPWSSDLVTLASNIQSALISAQLATNVIVTSSLSGDAATFVVEYVNNDGNKLRQLLTVTENTVYSFAGIEQIEIGPVLSEIDLPRSGQSPLSVMVPQRGTPINDVAENIVFHNNIPIEADGNWFPGNTWVESCWPTCDSTILVGTLKPSESAFFWIKRTIPSTAVLSNGLLASDTLTLTIVGSGTDPY